MEPAKGQARSGGGGNIFFIHLKTLRSTLKFQAWKLETGSPVPTDCLGKV